jgi:hypothetical protein
VTLDDYKRSILIQVCEMPGWTPPSNAGLRTETALEELSIDGWLIPRLDGWEATPQALREYPFGSGRDEAVVPADESTVPIDRVVSLIAAMLETMPFVQVVRLVTTFHAADETTSRVARGLAEELRICN